MVLAVAVAKRVVKKPLISAGHKGDQDGWAISFYLHYCYVGSNLFEGNRWHANDRRHDGNRQQSYTLRKQLLSFYYETILHTTTPLPAVAATAAEHGGGDYSSRCPRAPDDCSMKGSHAGTRSLGTLTRTRKTHQNFGSCCCCYYCCR